MPILALMVLYIRLIMEEVLLQEQKHEASISISSSKLPMTFINVSDSYPSGLSGASYPTTVISTTKEVLVTAN